MNRNFYLGLSILAVVVIAAVALGAQSRFFKGDWGGLPLSHPVSGTLPLPYPYQGYGYNSAGLYVKPVSPLSVQINSGGPSWSEDKLSQKRVVYASRQGKTILEPEKLPLDELPAGNQQPWIKRIQFAYLIEKMIGYFDAKPIAFPGCDQYVADYGVPQLYGWDEATYDKVVCYMVSNGFMPTLDAPVKGSFYGGQNITRLAAASVLQRVFDPSAAPQDPPTYYSDMKEIYSCMKMAPAGVQKVVYPDAYNDIQSYMWAVYWLDHVKASDVESWQGKDFRPYDSLTISEAMTWLQNIWTYMPKENWPKW